jgi:hypothetical protein
MPNVMNRLSYLIFSLVTLIFACSKSSKTNIKQVSWTGSSHSYGDTIVSVDHKDTLYNFKYLYLAHHIIFDENGDGILITRSEYDAPRQFYNIKVADSVIKVVFDLLQDTSLLNFKQPAFDQQKEGRIYCGFNYLICITDKENQEKNINYLPPDANDKLKQLNKAFELILHQPNIKGKVQVDTLTLDSIILEKVIYFNPNPPLRSTVKFTPPLIEPDIDTRD